MSPFKVCLRKSIGCFETFDTCFIFKDDVIRILKIVSDIRLKVAEQSNDRFK